MAGRSFNINGESDELLGDLDVGTEKNLSNQPDNRIVTQSEHNQPINAEQSTEDEIDRIGLARLVLRDESRTDIFTKVPSSNSDGKIYLQVNKHYLHSCACGLKVLHIMLSVVTIIILATSPGRAVGGSMLVLHSVYFRIVTFVLVLSLLLSAILLFVHACGLIRFIPYNWPIVELVVHSSLALLFLLATTLIASKENFYNNPTASTAKVSIHLIAIVVLGYVGMLTHATAALHAGKRCRNALPRRYREHVLLEDSDILEV